MLALDADTSPGEGSMHFDAYTKAVLTIIAGALCALVAQNAVRQSKADDHPLQKVQICDEHDCLRLSPLRKRTSFGVSFLSYALPIFVESEP
jgi:hypothetical protein